MKGDSKEWKENGAAEFRLVGAGLVSYKDVQVILIVAIYFHAGVIDP